MAKEEGGLWDLGKGLYPCFVWFRRPRKRPVFKGDGCMMCQEMKTYTLGF